MRNRAEFSPEVNVNRETIVPRGKTNYGREVLEPLEIKGGEKFVDIGSGIGLQTLMAGKLNRAEAVGVEFDKGTIKLAEFIAKITELSFKDRKTGKKVSNIIKETEELIARKTAKKFEDSKFYDLAKNLERGEFSDQETEKLQRELMDWMVNKNLYNIIYRKLKSGDTELEEKIAETKLPKNVKFIQGDVVHLPIRSDSTDKILCLDILHWIPLNDRKKVITEIFRIAKNGGKLMMSWKRMEGLGKNTKEIIEESGEIERQIITIAKDKNIDLKTENNGIFIISKLEKENHESP